MASIIPIFIPHEGCPHSCVFCNQNSISGSSAQRVTPAEVTATIETWLDRFLSKQAYPVQVAFYGGSFTGLEYQRQQELLGAVTPFLDQGRVHHIRLSTRPDYIDQEKLALLKKYQVDIVELGVQSLDDTILRQAGRGHSKGDVYRAVDLLQKGSFQVGMQLMLGLPGQSFSSLRRTVARKQSCCSLILCVFIRYSWWWAVAWKRLIKKVYIHHSHWVRLFCRQHI